jgi:hypothetical protein
MAKQHHLTDSRELTTTYPPSSEATMRFPGESGPRTRCTLRSSCGRTPDRLTPMTCRGGR